MKHYFCPSCGGVDTTPHACQTPGCSLEGHDLKECDCDNPDSHKKTEPPAEQGDEGSSKE